MTGVGVGTWQEAVAAASREAGLDAVSEIAVAALRAELPVLAEADLLAMAHASTAANIALVVELLRGSVDLADVEPPPQANAFARELARRNVPVAQLDRAYRVAQRALWRWAVGEVHARVAVDGLSAAIEELSEAVFATGDVFAQTVMERYAAERERWLRGADAVRAATVEELLAGGPVDVTAASGRLGYELRQTHVAFVVWLRAGEVAEGVAAAIAGGRGLLWPLSGGAVAGWCPEGALDVGAAGADVLVAVGRAAADADGFRLSHAEAQEARRVARLTGASGVVAYADVALTALLTRDPDQARRFARTALGPLAEDDPAMARLRDTLHAALEHQGSPRRAAEVLGVHENTVAKRLKSIENHLGDDARARPAELLAALTIIAALGP